MNPAALLSRLSVLRAASDADAFLIGAAAAGLLVVAGLAAAAYRRERRPSEVRDDRRRGDEEAARRLRETEELRLRLVGLERKLEEAAQALAARAALDAAGPAPSAAAPAGAAPAPAAAGTAAPPLGRALVCVPDATVARVFESLLRPCGYETDRCADGIDAAALAARRGPAAAILDLDALGADAPAIVRAVRARLAKPARLLVVAHDEASALRAGAERSEVLLRPLDFLEAVRRVRAGAAQEARR